LQDPLIFPTAHSAQSGICFLLGDFLAACTQAEHAVEKYDVQKHGSLIFLHGEDPGIMGLTFQSWTLWYLGYPDQALRKCEEANLLTQTVSHPFNVSHVQMFMAWLHHLRGEPQETQRWADTLIAFSIEQEVPFWLGPGFFLQGWTLTEKEAWIEGVALMRRGLEQVQALGAEVWEIVYQAMISGAYIKAKRLDEAQRCLEEALAKAQEVGEFFYSAELHRLQGELLFAQGNKN
jgi:adenylate cyclase